MTQEIDLLKYEISIGETLKMIKTRRKNEFTEFDITLLITLFYEPERIAITNLYKKLMARNQCFFKSKMYQSIDRLLAAGYIELLPRGVWQFVRITGQGKRYLEKYKEIKIRIATTLR